MTTSRQYREAARWTWKLLWYWLLAFKLAGDEVLGIQGPRHQALAAEARELHGELFGAGEGRR